MSEEEKETPPPSSWRLARRLGAWVIALVVIASLVAFLRGVEVARVISILRSADPWLVGLAIIVNLTANTYARVRRRLELVTAAAHSGPSVGLVEMTALFFASYAANNMLPARAGDVLFALEMKRRHGYALPALVAAQLAEKIVEIGSLWILAWLCLALTQISAALLFPLDAFLALGAVGLTIVVAVVRRKRPADVVPLFVPENAGVARRQLTRAWIALRAGLQAASRVATPGVALRAFLWSCAQDLSDVVMVAFIAQAVGVHVGPGGWLLIYLTVNLAATMPGTPGQIGLFEAAAVLALVGQGVGQAQALAFALLYHAVHLVPLTLVGAAPLVRMRFWRGGAP